MNMKKEKKVFKRVFLIGLAILICVSGLFFARHVRALKFEGQEGQDLQVLELSKQYNTTVGNTGNLVILRGVATGDYDYDAANIGYVKDSYAPGGTSTIWDCGTKDGDACATGTNSIYLLDNASWNVGIGTSNVGAKLHIEGGTPSIFLDNTGETLAEFRFRDSQGTSSQYFTLGFNSGDEKFYMGPDADTDVFVIDNTGKVGIKETVPSDELTVAGTIGTNLLEISDYGYALGGFHVGDIGDPGTDNLIVDGNVGIGVTSPLAKLQVSGGSSEATGLANARENAVLWLKPYSGSNWGTAFGSYSGQIQYIQAMYSDQASSRTLVINPFGGNVGIGDTTPSYKLDVNGTIAFETMYHHGDGDNYMDFNADQVIFVTGGTELIRLTETSQNSIVFNEGSADVDFRVESDNDANALFVRGSDGNVGIGTTVPQAKLHVWNGQAMTSNGTGGYLVPVADQHLTPKKYVDDQIEEGVEGVADGYLPDDPADSDVNMNNHLILNIGNAATDFTSGGGLNVYGNLNVSDKQIYGGFGAEATAGTLDWNHVSNARSGNGYTLLTGNATNGPTAAGSNYFHPFSFEYSSKSGGGNMNQLAIPYSGSGYGPYYRTRYSGEWTGWTEFWTSGNDGTTSGLDADLLDGSQKTAFQMDVADSCSGENVIQTITQSGTVGCYNTYSATDDAIGSITEWQEGCSNCISVNDIGDILTASEITDIYVLNTSDSMSGDLTIGDDLFVNDFARIDALRVGTTSTDPGDGNLVVEGKITATEMDPPYSIDGTIYATYGHSTTGLKEETTGKVELSQILNSKSEILNKSKYPKSQIQNDLEIRNSDLEIGGSDYYYYVIDFSEIEVASDLWLFKEITAFGDEWNDLIVTLTPEGKADVWYEFMPKENKLIIYGNQPVKVSYRLMAPRFDWPERDTNLCNGTGKAPEGSAIFVR